MVLCIVILSVGTCLFGLLSGGGNGNYEFQSINNETVTINGTGLYKNDSVSATAQGKASDFVTLFMAVPLLLGSLYFTQKGSFRGKILLTGTLGYFLYTYISYTFLWMYNPLFIIYVAIMSLSLFAFIQAMTSFDLENIISNFKKQLPVKILGGFQIFIAFALAMLWLGKISPSIFQGLVPVGLEHYTTLVIQGMDLGFVVPAALLSGILLIKKRSLGYLLSSVIIVKSITMLTCISAMIVNMSREGVKMSMVEAMLFPMFNLLAVGCLILLLKNTMSEKHHV